MIEVEIKLPITNIDMVRQQLIEQGFVMSDAVTEEDTYFDDSGNRILTSGCALRIRESTNLQSGDILCTVNYKGPRLDSDTMTREESETTIGDANTVKSIFKALGLQPAAPVVRKKRFLMKKQDVNACLDDVEGLGAFLELEIIADDYQKDEALGRINTLLKLLGYQTTDTVTQSYLSMLQRNRKD